jgi:hypothetical protein
VRVPVAPGGALIRASNVGGREGMRARGRAKAASPRDLDLARPRALSPSCPQINDLRHVWRERVVGCWLLVVGCWLSVVGCWLLVVGCRLSVVGCRLSVVGCRLSVVGCRLSVVGCRLSVVGCRLSVVGNIPSSPQSSQRPCGSRLRPRSQGAAYPAEQARHYQSLEHRSSRRAELAPLLFLGLRLGLARRRKQPHTCRASSAPPKPRTPSLS